MATAQDIQSVLEQKTVRLRQLEAPYLRALDYQKSLDWQTLRDSVLAEVQRIIAPIFGKDPNETTFACGKIKQVMLKVQEPLDVIVEYESLKREIETYYKTRG